MKKGILLFVFSSCLLVSYLHSQKAVIGLTGGVSASNIYGNINGLDTRGDVRAGMTMGMVLDVPMCKENIRFQPGLHYVQKGRFTRKDPNVREAEATRYADLVLNFLIYAGNKNKTRLFLGAGPQFGMNLPSKIVRVEDDDKREIRSILFGNKIADDYRGLDWGANGLAGLVFKNGIFFSVNYTLGFRNILPKEKIKGEDKLRNGCLGVRIGYFFPNSPKEKKPKKKKGE
ncbi:MAG: PorT family protein [Chitinophagaceae bacterium]|nr:PorT family protein [Chitinophagaceae bacterium]